MQLRMPFNLKRNEHAPPPPRSPMPRAWARRRARSLASSVPVAAAASFLGTPKALSPWSPSILFILRAANHHKVLVVKYAILGASAVCAKTGSSQPQVPCNIPQCHSFEGPMEHVPENQSLALFLPLKRHEPPLNTSSASLHFSNFLGLVFASTVLF